MKKILHFLNADIDFSKRETLFIYCITILIGVWGVYGNTLNNKYNIDDKYYLNIMPEEGSGFKEVFSVFEQWFNKNNYRPIPALSLSIEQFFFGRDPVVFHLFNLIYYSLLCFVILLVLQKMQLFKTNGPLLFLLLLFIVHPVHSNVVASIKNRDIIQAMLFGLIGFYFLIDAFSIKTFWKFFIGVGAMYLAMLCKYDAVIFIAFFALYITLISRKISFKSLILFGVMVIASIILVDLFEATIGTIEEPKSVAVSKLYENPLSEGGFSFAQKLGLVIPAMLFYLKFLIVPSGYYFYFGYNQIPVSDLLSLEVILGLALLIGFLLVLIYRLIKGRRDAITMGMMTLFILLFPYLLLINHIAGIVAVRYVFYASFGFCILVIALFDLNFKKNSVVKWGMAFGIVLALSFFSIDRNADWKDKETLFNKDLPHLKDSFIANRMMAGALFEQSFKKGMSTKEIATLIKTSNEHCAQGLKIYDKEPQMWEQYGLNFARVGEEEKAIKCFNRAIALDSSSIYFLGVLAKYCQYQRRYIQAEKAAFEIIERDSFNLNAFTLLNEIYLDQQNYEKAIDLSRKVIMQDSSLYFPYKHLGDVYMTLGDTLNFADNYFKALELGYENENLEFSLTHLALNSRFDMLRSKYAGFFE